MAKRPGLYANIHAKKKRIAAGSGEKMRKPGSKGAPTAKAFRESAKTAKKKLPLQVLETSTSTSRKRSKRPTSASVWRCGRATTPRRLVAR